MSIEQFNKNTTSVNLINSINLNTGIDNSSSSSKVKLLSDAFAEEVFNTNTNISEVLSRVYTTTATGDALDINGSEHGIYRTFIPAVNLLKDDNVVFISPLNETLGFDDIIVNNQIISAGEEFEIDGSYIVLFLESVVVTNKFQDVAVFVKIKPIANLNNLSIDQDSIYEMSNYTNPYTSLISLKFGKPVSFTVDKIDDDTYRNRIQAAKILTSTTSEQFVGSLVQSIPGTAEFVVKSNENGSGFFNVYFLTSLMKTVGFDTSYQDLARYIISALKSNLQSGVTYDVILPKQLELHMNVTNSLLTLTDTTVQGIIAFIFRDFYRYSDNQVITTGTLNQILSETYQYGSSIKINSFSIYDTALSAYVSTDQTSITLDHKSYLLLQKTNILVGV